MTTVDSETYPAVSATRSLTRDVSINVVANLIASAIIYILAVAFGYIKLNAVLLLLALIFVIPLFISLVMVLYGGFKYVTSGGDSGTITGAMRTIVYAVLMFIIVAIFQLGASIGEWLRGGHVYPMLLVVEFVVLGMVMTSGMMLAKRQRVLFIGTALVKLPGFLSILVGLSVLSGYMIPAMAFLRL